MKEIAIVLLTVIGGLGTFLLGMKHLSEGLQAENMRLAIEGRFVWSKSRNGAEMIV